jgi:AraC family transcriptional regulator, regulatory protein of adaptative response / methylated-DNA-[protein]-cysteine methyltransferase
MVRPAKRSISAPRVSRDEGRWAAVVARDRAADGTFFYSVATTGIYCRPSCPSRAANRSNVRFYDTCATAEAAGFRACKRCKPGEAAPDAKNAAMVIAACRAIENADTGPSLTGLAEQAGLSPFHFHRLFKTATGLTPKAYATAHRHKRVRDALPKSATVTDAIYASGFNSNGRFYASAKDVLGMTPANYKSGGSNADIMFAIGPCTLGAILVAATDKGVAAILMGDDAEELLRDLQDRFPKANLIGGDKAFDKLVARSIGLIEDPARAVDLPLDVQGTVFQHKVWAALKCIPAGTTVSYAEVAQSIGAPKSVRAVARACGANPVAVVIPCHRVVRNDGSLSGYRWGLERKRALLDREAGAGNTASKSKRRG